MRRGGGGGNYMAGPLMTDHFQGLQDIDKELELLKRKRTIIEQQQQLLEPRFNQQYDYNRPSYNDQQYNEPQYSYEPSRHERPSRKRQGIAVWDNEPPSLWQGEPFPKRFAGKPRPEKSGANARFGSRLGPPPKPQPLKFNNKPRGPSGSFNNYKGPAKNNRAPPALRPAPPPRAAPAPKADAPGPAVPQKSTKISKTAPPILTVEALADNQINGRLELALGQFMKDLREQFGNKSKHAPSFRSPLAIRVMKQQVRERIRSAMLGKPVGPIGQIMEVYREHYPPQTDEEILSVAFITREDDYVTKNFNLIDSGDPEKFYRDNMNLILDKKLKNMIDDFEQSFKKNPSKLVITKADIAEQTTPKDEELETNDIEMKDVETPEADGKVENNVETSNGNDDKDKDNVEQENEQKIDEDEEKVNEIVDVPKEEKTKNESADNDIEFEKLSMGVKTKIFDSLIAARLPTVLRRYIPYIKKHILQDSGFTSYKAVIDAKVIKKTITQKPVPSGNKDDDMKIKEETHTPRIPPTFFIKIISRPSLPKRKLMHTFLEPFNPRSIKKLKHLHNLLFVGFSSQEDYDNILAADGTKLGKFTLEIKVNERKPKDAEEINKSSTSVDKLITPELDDQITNLLTSIRKSEEEEEANGENEEIKDGQNTDDVDIKEEKEEQNEEAKAAPENGEAQIESQEKVLGGAEVNEESEVVKENDNPQEPGNPVPEPAEADAATENVEVKEVPKTPVRASARIASTPTIQTRRASRLQN